MQGKSVEAGHGKLFAWQAGEKGLDCASVV